MGWYLPEDGGEEGGHGGLRCTSCNSIYQKHNLDTCIRLCWNIENKGVGTHSGHRDESIHQDMLACMEANHRSVDTEGCEPSQGDSN
jgi:hypothetical protein